MEWTEDTISRLKELWAEGLSTAEIGRRLSITKNAVVGKAHRLGLPARPSPIRRGEKKAAPEAAPKATVAATAALPSADTKTVETAPVAASAAPESVVAAPVQATPAAAPATPQAAVQPKVAKVEKPAAPRAPAKPKPLPQRISDPEPKKRRGPTCCWPIGDPGTPGFHFCGAVPLPGKPYCAEHAQIAYVKLRDRRDNVA
ncbi:GcrA family cell cycle regulator [Acetobacter indonesiensis]|uniref:GcrA family cell cycle regulator n=1 Tax=Acetobacter indonesiensis TaxID=104101 RepID=UPI0020A26930|nr:GcrA family cell cycle regulator [Acetobacter indonesiensis]MCP1230252.1 GcrA family cell cycle regulator [Acetobacter indonesiensis]